MKRSKGFTLIELLVVISIIALLIGILLPALGAARRAARQMTNTTQVRGIVQAMAAFASGNKDYFPGVDSKGLILEDDTQGRNTGNSGHGATVEGRWWIMLDGNSFDGKYCISPSETKTVWTTEEVEDDNYSYALLNIDDGSQNYTPSGTTNKMPRPNQSGRNREWGAKINSQAALIADRARHSSGDVSDSTYEELYSIHTSEDDEEWKGSVGYSDARAQFESEAVIDSKYGSASSIESDRLFMETQQSGNDFDVISTGATWRDDSNALLGYTGEGHPDNGEVVSK